jgi:hypothetical protein
MYQFRCPLVYIYPKEGTMYNILYLQELMRNQEVFPQGYLISRQSQKLSEFGNNHYAVYIYINMYIIYIYMIYYPSPRSNDTHIHPLSSNTISALIPGIRGPSPASLVGAQGARSPGGQCQIINSKGALVRIRNT